MITYGGVGVKQTDKHSINVLHAILTMTYGLDKIERVKNGPARINLKSGDKSLFLKTMVFL